MSYSFSQGQTGSLTALSINTGTTVSPVYTLIEEIQSCDPSGNEVKTVNATNLQSLVSEVLTTLPDPGSIKCSCLRVPGSVATGQSAVLTQFNLGSQQAPILFKLALPKDAAAGQTTAGDAATFSAYVTECNPMSQISAEKPVMFDFTLKIVTLWSYTNGS